MSPEVRTLVVSPPATVWGAQIYLLEQVAALRDRGIGFTLASPRGTPFADEWVKRGHQLIDVPLELHDGLREHGGSGRPGLRSLLSTASGVRSGIAEIAKVAKNYDVVYSFALRSHYEVALGARRAGTPVVLDLVNIVRPGVGRVVLRRAARRATLTVANSRATAAVLGRRPNVKVIHPGIDLNRFHPGPADPGLREYLQGGIERPVVAIIGRLDVRKGVQVLVDAMTMVEGKAADARLVVVGEAGTGPTEFADQLRSDAQRRLGDRVLFTGRRSDIPQIMRAVDLVVMASAAEPFGLSALEAQASRTPVIGTNSGGLVEFVDHEVTGLLVPPFEAKPLAEAIERIFTDQELTDAMVDLAERRANPARGLEAQYDELAQMYRDVAASKGGRRG